MRSRCEEEIASGEMYPCLFVICPESPIARRFVRDAVKRRSSLLIPLRKVSS